MVRHGIVDVRPDPSCLEPAPDALAVFGQDHCQMPDVVVSVTRDQAAGMGRQGLACSGAR